MIRKKLFHWIVRLLRLPRTLSLLAAGTLLAVLAMRAHRAFTGDPLEPWHGIASARGGLR